MKIRIILSFMIFCTLHVSAQKKELAQAKYNVKRNIQLHQTQQILENLLKDSANADNIKIRLVLFDAIKKQYDMANENIYLGSAKDSSSLFNNAKKMFEVLFAIDTLDIKPDHNGKIKSKYRKKHADILNTYRSNILFGGLFNINKAKYKEAYDFLELYILSAKQPLLADYDYERTDKNYPTAAYWAVYSGYKMNDTDKALRYVDIAFRDTKHHEALLQYLSEIHKMRRDTANYVETLTKGFEQFTANPYFFSRLFDFYSVKNNWKKGMQIVEYALKKYPEDQLFRFAQSTVFLNTARYDQCVEICKKLIAENDTLPNTYLNIGLAYFNKAVDIDRGLYASKKKREEVLQHYKKAMPFLEKYRQCCPDDKDKWLLPLYTIYLNLNLGDKFDEVNRMVNQQKS